MPSPSLLPVVARERFMDDPALRSAMREAGHWDGGEMRRREALGDVCYMAMDGARCVHYSWISRRSMFISEVSYHAALGDGDRWVYNAYTAPSHRGRSLFPCALARMADDAAREGAGIVWAGVERGNAPSLKSILKAGYARALVLEGDMLLSAVPLRVRGTAVDGRLAGRFGNLTFTWGISWTSNWSTKESSIY